MRVRAAVVGIANATSAGWGNLGGGVAQIVNSNIFKACKQGGMTTDTAWRTTWPGLPPSSSS